MGDPTSHAPAGFTAGVLVGSLRRDSICRKVATAMAGLVPAGLTLSPLRIDDLPLYDEDLVFLDMPTMQQPEAYLGGSDAMLDADGMLRSDAVRELLTGFLAAFGVWVAGHVAVPA